MIGLLILAQEQFGKGLLHSVEHVLGELPAQLEAMPVDYLKMPEQIIQTMRPYITRLDQGQGLLVLADVYGASHTNAACRLLGEYHMELVSGVNLPMLIRVLNYRDLSLEELIAKAVSGGIEGIVRAPHPLRVAEGGR
jgi:PTS system ascorbate-specific IIA component